MTPDLATLVTAFVTLFVIVDPIGTAQIFVPLTSGMPPARRRSVAARASIIGIAILALFGLFGEAVLGFVGISMPAFRIAGGILLFLTALEMLFSRRTKRREDQAAEDDGDDPSVFPLAIPLLAGPGSITTMILLTDRASGPVEVLLVHLVMALVIAVAFVLFLAAGPIERLLGPVGLNVATRLLGMLLAALSVQFVIDGFVGVGLAGPGPGVGGIAGGPR